MPSVGINTIDDIPPAPPSERKQVATTMLSARRGGAPVSAPLPKVLIGAKHSSAPPPSSAPAPASDTHTKRSHMETLADAPQGKRVSEARAVQVAVAPIDIEKVDVEKVESAPIAVAAAPIAVEKVAPAESAARVEAVPAREAPEAPARAPEMDDLEDVSVEEEISIEEAPAGQQQQQQQQQPPPPKTKKKATEMTVEDHVRAGDLARTTGRDDEALAQYKKALAKLGTAAVPLRAQVYIYIADLMRKKGDLRLAISNFDKALTIAPADQHALASLIELNVEQQNWRAVQSAEDKYLAGVRDDDARLQALLLSAERWRVRANDLRRAKERVKAASALAPRRVEPLEQQLAIYEAEGALEHVLDMRRRIADLTKDPRARARLYFDLGRYCLEKAREDEALGAFELALDADPTLLQSLEVLANTLAEGQEWGELDRVYKKMISSFGERERDAATETVLAELQHRRALLLRDHLEDPEGALLALREELALRPDLLSVQLLAASLAEEVGEHDAALEHLRAAARLEPARAETYHRMVTVARLADDDEQAFLAASVVVVLGAADDRERAIHREHKGDGVPALHHPLAPDDWKKIRPSGHDEALDEVMRALAPAVLRARLKRTEGSRRADLAEQGRQDVEKSTISAVRSLGWACQFLGVAAPAVYLDEQGAGGYVPKLARQQSTVVGKDALRGRSLTELAFLAGRHLALRLPEHELVAHLKSVDELSSCFLAALKMVLGAAPATGEQQKVVEALAASLASYQLTEERDALIAAVDRVMQSGGTGGTVNMPAWVGSVERFAARTGLLLSGDLETAAKLIRAEGDGAAPAAALLEDLYAFAVSSEHHELRETLGIKL
jgi:tetratricopeptide (TPR) repeat protein